MTMPSIPPGWLTRAEVDALELLHDKARSKALEAGDPPVAAEVFAEAFTASWACRDARAALERARRGSSTAALRRADDVLMRWMSLTAQAHQRYHAMTGYQLPSLRQRPVDPEPVVEREPGAEPDNPYAWHVSS